MDPIKKKLLLIEDQLNRPDFHKQLFQSCPLLFAAVGLIIGILIQDTLNAAPLIWLILLLAGAAVAITLFTLTKSFKTYPLAYAALICFACLGAIRLTTFCRPAANDIRNLITDTRTLATIKGSIVTEPYINRNQNWKFRQFVFADHSSSFYLDITQALTTTGFTDAQGLVRVQIDEPVFDLSAGDHVQIHCWLEKFSPPTNPGQFNTAKFLARKNVFLAASVNSRSAVELLKDNPPANTFLRTCSLMRTAAKKMLLTDLDPQSPSQGLLEALLLGFRTNIDNKTYNAFRETGLLHFISLSGMHLGILIAIFWWLCKAAGLLKPARAALCLLALALYLMIVPARPPTLRAALICAVFFASFFFHRKSNSLNTLSLAAIILLLINPTGLFNAGWQLSFASVLGILLFSGKIQSFLYFNTPNPLPSIDTPRKTLTRLATSTGNAAMKIFTVGLAAWLGSAGVLLYHFHTICPLTCIWTVIAFPLVALILTLGYAKLILAFLLPTAAVLLAPIVTTLCELLVSLVRAISRLNISEILLGTTPVIIIVLYYICLFFARFVRLKNRRLKNTISITTALALISLLSLIKYQKTHPEDLTITCLNVGHGQAILTQLPGNQNILFDAGSIHYNDIGRKIVIPFLNHIGIKKIHSVIISHTDTDHINGIPEIVENSAVESIYTDSAFLENIHSAATTVLLDRSITENNLKIQPLDTKLETRSSADIKFLWPDEQSSKDKNLTDNEKSTVTLITFAGKKILLCADIENYAQTRLLNSLPNLTADIVVVPHHGSIKSLLPGFLETLNPEILICSCGKAQYQRQKINPPSDKTALFYTPAHGAVTIKISPKGNITTTTFIPRK